VVTELSEAKKKERVKEEILFLPLSRERRQASRSFGHRNEP